MTGTKMARKKHLPDATLSLYKIAEQWYDYGKQMLIWTRHIGWLHFLTWTFA